MIRAYRRFVEFTVLTSCLIPALAIACSRPSALGSGPGIGASPEEWGPARKWLDTAIATAAGIAIGLMSARGLRRNAGRLESFSASQVRWCERFHNRKVPWAILGAAALGLLLELALIRWHGTVFELFSYHKNLTLLACFLGLGLGYALSRESHIPLAATAPLLTFQVVVILVLRYGLSPSQRASLNWLPVREQLSVWNEGGGTLIRYSAVYAFLTASFLATALAFLPIGQVTGRLMERRPKLQAYGLNLLGSAAGVGLIFLFSALYLPPAIWFGVGFAGLLALQAPRVSGLLLCGTSGVIGLIALAWPVSPGWERLYSPYQLLERGPGENGLSLIRASGQYHQRIHNLSSKMQAADEGLRETAAYYEFPYRAYPSTPKDVAIVGAGTGNDIAAALRRGSQRVDAVEIDPGIIFFGERYHPEKPYDDPRVETIVDDARTFFRATDRRYDLIVYGLLDSVTLLSHGSNVRLDSFVYTVEGLREARAHLKPGGLLSLSFSVVSPELGRKIYLMLTDAFDGRPPRCVRARYNYDGSVFFLSSEDRTLSLPTEYMNRAGFRDVTAEFASPQLLADVSTDDWPFFYMTRRVYPASYLGLASLVVGLSVLLISRLAPGRPSASDGSVFFLGAGFMLVETKGITELGLALGNTWQVVGVVILGILLFAFLANSAVSRFRLRSPWAPLVLVLGSLGLGWWISRAGGLPPTIAGRIGSAALLTCPVFFSGIVFSSLLARSEALSRVMAANLLGALCGGLLEYNAMYFGFRFLYGLALVLYALAGACAMIQRGRSPRPTSLESRSVS
jgi:spermidine synthase